MKAIQALRTLGSVTPGQWGMVTIAQAEQLGVTRLGLTAFTGTSLFGELLREAGLDAEAVAQKLPSAVCAS